jgi:hypothetical protein
MPKIPAETCMKYALAWILFRVQSEKCTINLPVLVVNKDWRS